MSAEKSSRVFLRLMIIAASSVLVAAVPARAGDIQLASPFVDHMVIQRGKPIRVWGLAPGSKTVYVELADQKTQVQADGEGNWTAELPQHLAGGPFTLTASSEGKTTSVNDVLIGDVWLCSGQSNMQFAMQECDDANAVLSAPHPKLRLGKVGSAWTDKPQSQAKIQWEAASEEGGKNFSAVAYTFAHELEKDPSLAEVPVGVLEDCLGGTVIESWLPSKALSGFDPGELQSSMFGIGPTLLYNGMIAPLGMSSFAGVIWYQGEGNAGEPARYARLLPLLFQTWRGQFHDPRLPFLVVQLPDYATDWGGIYWQWIREAQSRAVAATTDTALAITLNTNDGWNLHPQGKHEIGRRLSLLARQKIYGEKVVGEGPVFESTKVDGSNIVVSFNTDGDGLTAGTHAVDGFMIAGDDGVYHAAQGMIDGDSVVLNCAQVPAPKTVRYAWAGVPHGTLMNRSGLPAAPFRTDTLSAVKGLAEPQLQAPGYELRGADYLVDVSSTGRITNLACRFQQFISNAPESWGGAGVVNHAMQKIQVAGPQTILCDGNDARFSIEVTSAGMNWTIENADVKQSIKFDIALASGVEVSGDVGGPLSLSRKGVSLHVTGVDRVTQFHDPSAEDGKVLEVDIPASGKKVLRVSWR